MISDRSKGIDVGGKPAILPTQPFGCRELHRAEECSTSVHCFSTCGTDDAEVEKDSMPIGRVDHHVRRLHIPMKHSSFVQNLKRGSDIQKNLLYLRRLTWSLVGHLFQRIA